MAKEEVVAQTKDGLSATFHYDFGASLDEMVDLFTEVIAAAHCKRSLVVAAQGHARGLLRQGKTEAEIRAAMEKWKPGEPRVTKTSTERLHELLDKMSPDDRAAAIKELKASSKAAAA